MRLRLRPRVLLALAITALASAPAQIIDYHQHLYSPVAGPISVPGWKGITADELISLMDAANIRRAVVLSTAYSLANPHKPPVPDEREAVGKDNDWTTREIGVSRVLLRQRCARQRQLCRRRSRAHGTNCR